MAVTQEDVFKAAQQLLDQSTGLVPAKITIAMVRERLGGTGSQQTLAKHLRAWKAAMNVDDGMPAEVSAAASELSAVIWNSAKAEAERAYHDDRRRAAEQVREAEEARQALEVELENAQATITEQLEVNSNLIADSDRLRDENTSLVEEANRLASSLAEKEKELALVSKKLENTEKARANGDVIIARIEAERGNLVRRVDELEGRNNRLEDRIYSIAAALPDDVRATAMATRGGMRLFSITSNERSVLLRSPFHQDLPREARKLSGRWDDQRHAWTFPFESLEQVRELCARVYGGVPGGDAFKDVDLVCSKTFDTSSALVLYNRQIASIRYGQVRLGDGVQVLSGEISAGPAEGDIRVTKGTAIRVSEVFGNSSDDLRWDEVGS